MVICRSPKCMAAPAAMADTKTWGQKVLDALKNVEEEVESDLALWFDHNFF
jgi:hypothetical protein